MALFVLSYARNDGEPLVRKFFNRLCFELSTMYPGEKEAGFMDTQGIPVGSIWQETLGGKLQSTPVLVPVFSPSFFASHNCGQEVQAFLERIQLYASSNPRPAVTPRCILPVTWVWPNLTVHPALKDFQYQDVSYPQKYLDKIVGLRMLVELKHKRDQFLTFSNRLAVAINDALLAQARAALPPGQTDYRELPNAFAAANASPVVSGPKSVKFAYVAPTRAELGLVRANVATYGAEGRDWRAFDPACPSGIGLLSEGVAAKLKMPYDALPLDAQFADRVDAAHATKGQVVFVIDSWAAKVSAYDKFFTDVDRDKYSDCPVLVPLNYRDEENRSKHVELMEALTRKLPNRAARGSLLISFVDEFDYEAQLGRTLAARQNELLATAVTVPAPATSGALPMI